MRFYFHLTNGEERIPDAVGVVAVSFESAQAQSIKAIQELLAEDKDQIEETQWDGWSLDVADSTGAVLMSFQLGAMQASFKSSKKLRLHG